MRTSDLNIGLTERLTEVWLERLEGAPTWELKELDKALSTGVSAFLSTPDDVARVAAARQLLAARRIRDRRRNAGEVTR